MIQSNPKVDRNRLLVGSGIAAMILITTILVPTWFRLNWSGFHNFDLGIYAQAVFKLSLDDLNPWLTVRNINVFNDHFDPVILIAAPFAKFLNPARVVLGTEHLLTLGVLPLLYFLYRSGRINSWFGIAAAFYLLLNRGILSALVYPVHPTTWAALGFITLGPSISARRIWPAVASLTFLFVCKEEFLFVGIMIGLGLMVQRRWVFGTVVLAWSSIWITGVFLLRPALLGPVLDYGGRLLDPLLADPGTALAFALDKIAFKRIFQCLIPLAPLVVWMVKNRTSGNWVLASALAPMLAIRFLTGSWEFHYMSVVCACLLMICVPKTGIHLPRQFALAVVALTLIAATGPVTQGLGRYVGGASDRYYSPNPQRLSAIRSATHLLLRENEGAALVEGNLIPLLVQRPSLYQLAGPQKAAERHYRWIFVEKPPFGDPWPLDHSRVAELIEEWRAQPGIRIITDDDFVFLAEGKNLTPDR